MRVPLGQILSAQNRGDLRDWLATASTVELREFIKHVRHEHPLMEFAKTELAVRVAEETREEERKHHDQIRLRLEDLKKPHWTVLPNFWFTVISAVAAVVAAYLAWLALKK